MLPQIYSLSPGKRLKLSILRPLSLPLPPPFTPPWGWGIHGGGGGGSNVSLCSDITWCSRATLYNIYIVQYI